MKQKFQTQSFRNLFFLSCAFLLILFFVLYRYTDECEAEVVVQGQ